MLQNIQLQVSALIPMVIICCFSFGDRGVTLRSDWLYRQLLLVTTLCISADIVSVVGIVYAPPALASALCHLYLALTLWTGFVTIYYLCFFIPAFHSRPKLRRWAIAVNAGLSLLAMALPLTMVNEPGVVYSIGPAVTLTFGISAVYIVGAFVLSFVYKSQINPYRRTAMRLWMLLEAAGAIIQYLDRRLLLVSYTMTVGIIILYATIENPEAKVDRGTGVFSFQMLREYMREQFEDHARTACVMLELRDARREESLSDEALLVEVVDYLSGLSERRLFRGSGNDFIMTFPDRASAEAAVSKLKARFEQPWAGGRVIRTEIFLVPDISLLNSAEEMLMLYQYGLAFGSNSDTGVTVVDASVLREVSEYRDAQRAISDALSEDRIEVYFQPIYSVKEDVFVSAEALVRMRDSGGRIVMPGAFIPAAEKSGLIERIGERVFEKVCRFIRDNDLPGLGIRYIEVNLSVLQCENAGLADRFSAMIERYRIDPAAINLEITESGRLEKKSVLMNNMLKLRDFGCSFSLDDFGTGESNLNYIVEMPVDNIKFDRSIIQSYFSNERTRLMMEHIIRMIKSMGMSIVAEGVEEAWQLEALAGLGVDFIQGFYFSKPIPSEQFLSFVGARRQAVAART